MNLTFLKSFYQVALDAGFTAAADSLGVSKGLVSRHICRLEAELSCQLFHRTTRKVVLTEAGKQLYARAEQIFVLAQNAQQEVLDLTQQGQGIVRFTSPVSLGERIVGEVLADYIQQCPGVQIELNFSSAAFDVVSGEQDIALRAFDELPDEVIAKPLGAVRSMLVASPEYLGRCGLPRTPLDIYEHECILSSREDKWNVWRMHDSAGVVELQVTGRLSVNNYSTAKPLAVGGYGIANLPYYLVEPELITGQLMQLFPDYSLPVHKFSVVHARQRVLPRKLRVLKELLIAWFELHPEYLLPLDPVPHQQTL